MTQTGSALTAKGGMTMPDREKVVETLESCVAKPLRRKDDRFVISFDVRLVNAIIDLLKEQEAVVPYSMNEKRTYGICPQCGKVIFRYGNVEENHYCGVCGKAVKWE